MKQKLDQNKANSKSSTRGANSNIKDSNDQSNSMSFGEESSPVKFSTRINLWVYLKILKISIY